MKTDMQNVSVLNDLAEAAPAAQAVSWSPSNKQPGNGNGAYLTSKDTFLEMTTDANQKPKRGSHLRSFSHDSALTKNSRATTQVPGSSDGDSDITCWSTCGSSMPSTPSICSYNINSLNDGTVTPSTGTEFGDSENPDMYDGSLEIQWMKGKEGSSISTRPRWCDMCDLESEPDVSYDYLQFDVDSTQENANQPQPQCGAHRQESQCQQQRQERFHATEHCMLDGCMAGNAVPFVPMVASFIPEYEQGPVQMPRWKEEAGDKKNKRKKKDKDLSKLNTDPNFSKITTLMIRGIPCGLSQKELLALLDNSGFEGKYDFFYMPWKSSRWNLGYAFINFQETIEAWTFAFTFNGFQLNPARSQKTCTVSPADIQGLESLRKHFRHTSISKHENGPMFLDI
eukprot:gnl/MRDRNA2_/MRDRNA2_35594_c0_seq1.p1 gnl/MRDRNA2_/MRDRNA2_35594_c0~~gnl/MRDRNA2_/MRDRNA2_35594_c0_seq1.p1  ORF type:complete len:397 (+),score=70.25 gnl/MRDRNA2_/MRDRNA2_35594_c0_seq1:173-1363(+)